MVLLLTEKAAAKVVEEDEGRDSRSSTQNQARSETFLNTCAKRGTTNARLEQPTRGTGFMFQCACFIFIFIVVDDVEDVPVSSLKNPSHF
jgi:hypothetical protein